MEENNKTPLQVDNNKDEEKYDVSHAPTPHVVHVQKSPWRIVLVVLLILLLAGGAGYLGYLYLQEKDNANNLQQQVETLNSQVAADDSAVTSESEPNSADTISYTAEVGKFSLTLPNRYVIIKNNDGGFEGGPTTNLEVAVATNNQGVVNGSIIPNKVISLQSQDQSLEEYIKNRNQEYGDVDSTKLKNINVDGVDAEVYRLGGLFEVNRVYFINDELLYEFESLAPALKEDLSEDLNSIIKGFKFTN